MSTKTVSRSPASSVVFSLPLPPSKALEIDTEGIVILSRVLLDVNALLEGERADL